MDYDTGERSHDMSSERGAPGIHTIHNKSGSK